MDCACDVGLRGYRTAGRCKSFPKNDIYLNTCILTLFEQKITYTYISMKNISVESHVNHTQA